MISRHNRGRRNPPKKGAELISVSFFIFYVYDSGELSILIVTQNPANQGLFE